MLNQWTRTMHQQKCRMSAKSVAFGAAVVGVLAIGPVAAQTLYLVLVIGDLEIYEVTLSDGSSPSPIDPNADGYEILLPEGSTLGTFSGVAQVAGAQSTPTGGAAAAASASAAVASVAEAAVSADAAAGGDPLQTQCPTDWIELETYSAALYYFSPDGADEGPSWSAEPPSFFIRCRADGRVVVWVGKPGTAPPVAAPAG
jgi:hypothetical protein